MFRFEVVTYGRKDKWKKGARDTLRRVPQINIWEGMLDILVVDGHKSRLLIITFLVCVNLLKLVII